MIRRLITKLFITDPFRRNLSSSVRSIPVIYHGPLRCKGGYVNESSRGKTWKYKKEFGQSRSRCVKVVYRSGTRRNSSIIVN